MRWLKSAPKTPTPTPAELKSAPKTPIPTPAEDAAMLLAYQKAKEAKKQEIIPSQAIYVDREYLPNDKKGKRPNVVYKIDFYVITRGKLVNEPLEYNTDYEKTFAGKSTLLLVVYDMATHMLDRLTDYNFYYYLNKNTELGLKVYLCIPEYNDLDLTDFRSKLPLHTNISKKDKEAIISDNAKIQFSCQILTFDMRKINLLQKTNRVKVGESISLPSSLYNIFRYTSGFSACSAEDLYCYKVDDEEYFIPRFGMEYRLDTASDVYKYLIAKNTTMFYLFPTNLPSYIVIHMPMHIDIYYDFKLYNRLETNYPYCILYDGTEYLNSRNITERVKKLNGYNTLFLYVHKYFKTHADVTTAFKNLLENSKNGKCMPVPMSVLMPGLPDVAKQKDITLSKTPLPNITARFSLFDFDKDPMINNTEDVIILSFSDFIEQVNKYADTYGLSGKLCIGTNTNIPRKNVENFFCGITKDNIYMLYSMVATDLYFFDSTVKRYLVIKIEPSQQKQSAEILINKWKDSNSYILTVDEVRDIDGLSTKFDIPKEFLTVINSTGLIILCLNGVIQPAAEDFLSSDFVIHTLLVLNSNDFNYPIL